MRWPLVHLAPTCTERMAAKNNNSETGTMRCLIADDHAIVRRGLGEILRDEFDRVHIGEAQNSGEALDLIWKQMWDVVILDISMPGRSGLEVLKTIRKSHPSLPVLVLSIHPEERYAVRVLKAGAAGYITKDQAPVMLARAVRKVCSGRKYISEELAETLAGDLERTSADGHQGLSDREYEVMRMIASGKTVSEVADRLSLSVKTISTYRSRVLDKLNMKTNAQLTYYAVKHGLVE